MEHARILLKQGDTAGAERGLEDSVRYHPYLKDRAAAMMEQAGR